MKSVLEQAYNQNGKKPVAFIDETYRTAEEHSGEAAFYVLTAVIIAPENFAAMRDKLQQIVGGSYWHTTENLTTKEGRETALELATYLGQGDEPCVFSIKTSAEKEPEELRVECFLRLIQELNNQPLLSGQEVDLFILEARRGKSLRGQDQRSMEKARKEGLARRSARLVQVSPSQEPLLWLPDLASSAMRQKISHRNTEYLEPFEHNVLELL